MEGTVPEKLNPKTSWISTKARLKSNAYNVTIQPKACTTNEDHKLELTLPKTRGENHRMAELWAHAKLKGLTSSKVKERRLHWMAREVDAGAGVATGGGVA